MMEKNLKTFRHDDKIFNYNRLWCSTNALLCCLNWCFGRGDSKLDTLRSRFNSRFIEISPCGNRDEFRDRLICSPSDSGRDYCVLTGDQVED